MTERPLGDGAPVEDAEPDRTDEEPPAPQRRSRWLTIGIPVAVVVAAAAIAGGIVVANRGSGTSATPTTAGLNYGTVARTTVAQTQSLSGTIAYTATQTIVNRLTPSTSSSSGSTASSGSSGAASSASGASATASGTLTTIAAVGSTVKVGGTFYTVNQEPVVAMYGTVPAYRDMASGDTGTDITQLQQGLSDLGYDPGSVDGTFGSATVTAVEAWQKAEGWTVDGIVHLGQIVFVSGPSRVIAQIATVGNSVSNGTPILSVGPESPVVTTSESSTQLGLLTEGQTVAVQLPDNAVVVGKVTSVGGGTSASSSSSSSSGTSGSGSGASSGASSTAATIALNNPALGNSIAGSSVNVIVTTDSVKGVLAVPLGALLATSAGQFVVQVPNADGSLADVSVNPSIYDDTSGIVAVPGANLSPGERVVVASS